MRVALITHAFPPSRHANGKRPFYIAKGLAEAGWEVDVFTSRLGCSSDFEETKLAGVKVMRIADPVVAVQDRLKPVKLLYKISVMITNGLMWPDFYAAWARNVIKKFSKVKEEYDRVICFVFPPSVYLFAKKQNLIDRRWVFDLQESVTPQFEVLPRRSPVQRYLNPRLEKLERLALSKAGMTVFTAQTNRQAYLDRDLVDKARAEHVPYFYDDAFFGADHGDKVTDKFSICYFGAFDWRGARSPDVFFASLKSFFEKNPEAREHTEFVFYGDWLAQHTELYQSMGLEDVVRVEKAVPYSEYLEKLVSSPVLLLIVAPEHNLFMPSKIVDYFGARRPILAYVPEGSEMESVLHEAQLDDPPVRIDDVEGGQRALTAMWRRFHDEGAYCGGRNTENWSLHTQMGRYVELLEGLVNCDDR